MAKYLLNALVIAFISCTKTQEDDDAFSNEEFVLQTSMANMAEIDISNLAAKKAIDDGVRAFAEKITEYHTTAQAQLRGLAIGLNLFAPDLLDAEHMTLRNRLLDLSGRAFDSLYIHTRRGDYQKTIDLLFREMLTGENDQLRDYSASLLPRLEVYLHQADSLANTY
jgi:putative membrane protein